MVIKYMLSTLLTINIVISIICIIYNSWNYYKDYYITMKYMGGILLYPIEYWLYVYMSFFSSLVSIIYLTLRYKLNINKQILNNVLCIISFILMISWLVIFICIILFTNYCNNNYKDRCDGGIINIVIGLISLYIWVFILYITSKRILKSNERYPALEAQASIEISRNNMRL